VGRGDDLGEHPLHVQGGADLDAEAGLVGARVGERVGHARGDLDDVAGAGEPGAEAEPEAHAPLRSPVTGFSSVWPGTIAEVVIGAVKPRCARRSMAVSLDLIRERLE
jgi:hypothetical protein